MEPLQAHKDGLPLMVIHPIGGHRPIAELFAIPGGIIYADIGWYGSTGHPFHRIDGSIESARGEYRWRIGEGAVIVRLESGMREYASWDRWRAWRESAEGADATRELAWQLITEDGLDRPNT